MPVPSSINDLSTTPGSNSPAGSESPATFDDYMRTFAAFIAQLRDGKVDPSAVVLLTGAQIIAGVKTFSSSPVVPDASFGASKIGNLSTARILGRVTAGAGVAEELTATQVTANFVNAASDTVAGKVELATAAEAPLRANAAVVLTPATLRDALNAQNDAPIFPIRAWSYVAGAGGTLNAGGNIAGITKNSTGDYTVNYTTAMPNANYGVVLLGTDNGSVRAVGNVVSRATGNVRVNFVQNGSNTPMDPSNFTMLIVC